MASVAISLNGTAKAFKWLELPGLPSKGDVSDFIASFKEPQDAGERLSILIEGADPYSPPKQKTLEDAIMPINDFASLDIPEKAELLKPWLKENSINLVSGWRGTGKTWFALGLCDSISRGAAFGPWECLKSASCLILDGEMPPALKGGSKV